MNKRFPTAATLYIFATLTTFAGCATQTKIQPQQPSLSQISLASPNHKIKIQLHQTPDGHLEYTVSNQSTPIIQPSTLGILLDNDNLAANCTIINSQPYETHDSYPTRGTHSQATDHATGATINLRGGKNRNTPWTLDLRCYDDGTALRYIINTTGKHTPEEATTFHLPPNSVVWAESTRGHYEDIPLRKNLANIKEGEFIAPPMTVELPNQKTIASFTEAAVYNYPGSAIQFNNNTFSYRLADKVIPSYPFALRYGDAGVKRITTPAAIDGKITTPWRVILIGDDLNTLVNSDLLTNLNPAPDKSLFPNGQATDWIKPGRGVWQYLDGHDNTVNGTKEFSQLAAALGFENNILEGYWDRWSDAELKDVVDYSRKRNVNIWVWMFSDPMRNIEKPRTPRPATATEPAQKPRTPEEKAKLDLRNPTARRALFERLHNLGVAGLKIDFIDTEAKEAEDFYEGTLKDAAEFHLMVDFHGSAKPTGEQRTFPNELTREAIYGLEHRLIPGGITPAKVHTILPFTRFLAGSGDYTPVIFTSRRGNTTFVHQIATAVLFTSALQTYAANPKNILLNPGADMMESIPSTWDETRVLNFSKIGEVAAFARRSGDTWFLAVANGETPREVRINLTFLGNKRYFMELLKDKDGDDMGIEKDKEVMGNSDILTLKLGVGGGVVARFSGPSQK